MKKRINILLLAGLLFSAVACDDSENNFSESTSTRIEQTLERYKFALQAGKTWVMEYFPDENLGYGGWIYIVEFQDDRMVKAWFEGSTLVEADPLRTESEYRVEFSTGPMLKFATHNDYLHFFSFPGDNGAGYQGWKGDYEFTFMSLSPAFDEIILRGIKTGNRIRMTPLSGQYTPESYLETIRSSQLAITETEFKVMANGEQIGTLTRPNATLTTNFRQYAASKVWSFRYSYRQQAFDDYGRPKVDEHGKPVYETVEANDPVSVIYLPDGIMQFYAPYTFRGELFGLPNQTVQTFKWQLGPTSASDCYVCTDSFLDIKLVP